MSVDIFRKVETNQSAASGTIEIDTPEGFWHNQLVVKADTATAGTLTIKYVSGGATFALKDAEGNPVTLDLSADPEPVLWDGLIDTLVIEQTGVDGTFDVTLLGSQ